MHPVLRTVLQRLGLGLITLLAVSIIIFSALSLLPGGYAQNILGQGATPETVAAFNKELGLDRPAPVRYVEWIGNEIFAIHKLHVLGRHAVETTNVAAVSDADAKVRVFAAEGIDQLSCHG